MPKGVRGHAVRYVERPALRVGECSECGKPTVLYTCDDCLKAAEPIERFVNTPFDKGKRRRMMFQPKPK